MMRLLRVLPSLDPKGGGPVESARQFDQELVRRGWHVEVVTLDAPGAGDFLTTYPAAVHALGPSRFNYRYNASLTGWLSSNRHRFDCVVVDGLWQYAGFGTWRALARTQTPYFVFSHGMLAPWFKRAHPLKHLKKWLYWPWAEYRVLRDATKVIFTCEEERIHAKQSFWLYRANEAVVPLGTSKDLSGSDSSCSESFLERHPSCRHKKVILFLGRLHPIKGCDLLLSAFSAIAHDHPDHVLVLAGPDHQGHEAHLRSLAEQLGIAERVVWTGMLSSTEKWSAFDAASVFCLPSHHENFGVVVAEAMSRSKPVLISNKVNIWREVVSDGAGIAFDDTVEGVTSALRTWLAMSPTRQATMGEAAKYSFDHRFQIEEACENLMNLLTTQTAFRSKERLGQTAGSN